MSASILIDFDAQPEIPENYTILPEDQIASRLKGRHNFRQEDLSFYLAPGQENCQKRRFLDGIELLAKLRGQPVVGAQLLDFYLENNHLIPERFKHKTTFFWGTLYRFMGFPSISPLCVRGILWCPEWDIWKDQYIAVIGSSIFDETGPALILPKGS